MARKRKSQFSGSRVRNTPHSRAFMNFNEDTRGRLWPLFVIFGIVILLIVGRLFYLQLFKHTEYANAARDQRTRDIVVHAKRGTIFDRSGNVLAKSVEAVTVYANPKEIEQPGRVAEVIVNTIGGDEAQIFNRVANHEKSFAYIAQKIDPADAEHLKEELKKEDLEGIYYLTDTKRVYPYGTVAGQVVGVVGQDNQGLSGLELYYDDILAGVDGELLVQRGRDGTPIAGGIEKELPAEDGHDIVISIDVDIQQQAEKAVAQAVEDWGAISGSAVVMDPKTGEILAACSTPYLNPNDLTSASAEALKLKSVTDAFEPGSTFKPITAAIAINEGKSDPNKTYTVPPSIKVGDHDVTDTTKHGYVNLTLREILRDSSNIGTVMVARETGGELFWDYLQKLHFGEKTGIDYGGESSGIVQKRENWNGSSLGSMAFGQGISTTPIQLCRAIGTIADEGLMRVPHFLISRNGERVEYPEPVRVFKTATASKVASMMETVVSEGTGKKGRIPGYKVAGKTGTAQRAKAGGGGYIEGSHTASFIGFAPSDDPKVLVNVSIEGTPDGYGGSTAGPPFKEIMKTALKRLGIPPEDNEAFSEAEKNRRAEEKRESEVREDMLERKGRAIDKEKPKEKKKDSDKNADNSNKQSDNKKNNENDKNDTNDRKDKDN